MKLSKINLLFILAGLLFSAPAWADTSTRGCETNTMKSGTYCDWTEGKSWCAGNTLTCAVESVTACPANTGVGTYSFNCNVNACTMTCTNPLPTGCSAYAANCIDCATCSAGYTLSGGTCITATLKLGSSSVFGASVIQAGADASVFVNGARIGIGSSTPASNLFIKASTGVEGFRILSSDYSPFIIRDTADSEDLFRVDQNGNVTFKGIISGANSPWIVNGNNLFASTTAWNVGIGTTTATEKLTIQTNATAGEQTALTLRHALTGAGDSVAIRFWPAGGFSGMTLPGKIVANAPGGNNIGFNFVTNNNGVANTAVSILPTGYVAIGTTTASDALTVVGNIAPSVSSGGALGTPTKYWTTSYIAGLVMGSGQISGISAITASTDLFLKPYSSSYVVKFGVGATEYARMTGTGDFGFGTTTPAAKMAVHGGNIFINDAAITSGTPKAAITKEYLDSALLSVASSTGSLPLGTSGDTLRLAGSTWISNSLLYNNGTNIGIGTTSPSAKVHIYTNGTNILRTEAVGTTGYNYLDMSREYNYRSNAIRFFTNGTQNWGVGVLYNGGSANSAFSISSDDTLANSRFLINSSGNIGIGTTTPVSKLHVYDTTAVDTYITLENAGGAGSGFRFLRNPTGYDNGFKNNAGIFYITTSANNFVSENNRLSVDYNGNVGMGGDITAGTDFTGASMVIKSGSVGIGTTTPATRLTVVGSGNYSIDATNYRIGNVATPVLSLDAVNKSYMDSAVSSIPALPAGTSGYTLRHNGTSWLSNATIYNDGTNVGIGTTTLGTYKLTVDGPTKLNGQITTPLAGSGNRCVYVDSTGNLAAKLVDCGTATGGDEMGAHSATQNIKLNTFWLSGDGGNEGVFVNAAGNVGVGTSSPSANLEIKNTSGSGNIFTITNSSGNTAFTIDNANLQSRFWIGSAALPGVTSGVDSDTGLFWPSPYNILGLTVGGSEKMRIDNSGSVGIGTTTSANSRLIVLGTGNYSIDATNFRVGNVAAPVLALDAVNKSYMDSALAAATSTMSALPTGISGDTLRLNGTTWTSNSVLYNNGTNIGIGTSSPAQKLDVIGVVNATGFRVGNTAGTAGNYLRSNGTNFVVSTIQAADVPVLNQDTTGYASTLIYEDNRTISPSELTARRMKFGFTSYDNNNAAPFADFLHFRSYQDSSGGADNLLVLNKTNMGMRVYQQTYGSATAYTSFKDVVLAENTPVANYITKYSGVGDNVSVASSLIYDNGTNVGINTTTAATRLTVVGSGNYSIDATNFRIGNVAVPVSALDAVNKSYMDSAIAAATSSITSLPAGTSGYTLRHNGTSWLSNATIFNDGTNVGVGTTTLAGYKFSVDGTTRLNGQITTNLAGAGNRCLYVDASGNVSAKGVDCGTATGGDEMGAHSATQNIKLNTYWLSGDGGNEGVYINASGEVGVGTNTITAGNRLTVNGNLTSAGTVAFTGVTFAGGGNRMITVDNSGVLGAAAIPVDTNTDVYWTGTATNLVAATGRTSLGLGALATLGAVAGGTGTTITDDTITNADINSAAAISASKIENGTYFINSAGTNGQIWTSDGTGAGAWAAAAVTGVTGTGTASYIPRWTSGTALGNSIIYDNGTYVGIGTAVPGTYKLNVNGATNLGGNLVTTGTVSLTGAVYAGGGNRMITVDNAGVLGAAAIPVDTNTDIYWTGTATNLVAATARTSLGLGALATLSAVGSTEITDGAIMNADINASAAIADSKIASGAYFITSAGTSGQIWTSDGTGAGAWAANAGITGSGTTNYISKWTNTGIQGNSLIFDNGTNVGINTTTAATRLTVVGSGNYSIDVANFRIGGVATPVSALDAVNKSYLDSAISAATSSIVLWGGSTGANVWALNSGNVGIGTTSPSAKLHVLGNAIISSSLTMGGDVNMGGNNMTNLNKLTVNTVDPLYNIKGVNYSTYAASVVGGVKEEYVGKLKIARSAQDNSGEYETIIDFKKVKEGSDLWVWRQVVDFSPENVQVLITPYRNFASVYYNVEGEQLIFRSDKPAEISYRLIGRRIDWLKWPTKSLDQMEKAGFKID